jgi:hypothetical protein
VRCCKEHPHHCISLILALVNSNKDKEYEKAAGTSRRASSSQGSTDTPEVRLFIKLLITTRELINYFITFKVPVL